MNGFVFELFNDCRLKISTDSDTCTWYIVFYANTPGESI